jgi:hypothetical protein
MSVEMDEMTMEQIIKQLRTGRQFGRPCVFARFDAALMLRDRGEWAMLRISYADQSIGAHGIIREQSPHSTRRDSEESKELIETRGNHESRRIEQRRGTAQKIFGV